MTATIVAKPNGTQVAVQINGVESLLLDNLGIVSGIKDASITPSKLSGGQSGAAPVYGIRAWCVFNGTLTGTNAPTAGGNIASVTRTAVGTYAVLFITSMPDANYAIKMTGTGETASGLTRQGPVYDKTSKTAAGFTLRTGSDNTALLDWVEVSITIVG